MGTLATNINKLDIKRAVDSACAQNSHMESLTSKLKDRNEIFIQIAKIWTPNKNQDPTTNLWRGDYLDKDPMRCIFKVNSHQLLDDGGTRISQNKRYPILSPNLSLLNANHIADKVADIPFSKGFHEIKTEQHEILNPISPLRFYFSINGKIKDKHVSNALQEIFTVEKIKCLKTKNTQGLHWRLIGQIQFESNERETMVTDLVMSNGRKDDALKISRLPQIIRTHRNG